MYVALVFEVDVKTTESQTKAILLHPTDASLTRSTCNILRVVSVGSNPIDSSQPRARGELASRD
jgi:hypothetical protein